ncbi:MAG: HDOD domain-containing protein [Desulfobulbaceae bacterium]|nr:HDOD domain-containing protein [Desulfobulbaceae bacterium]
MSELPAMSSNVQELISLTHSSRSAAYDLSKVILKDYSLTNKVLQVVNSAYYALGKQVNSISRAVTVLGFDSVRDLATAIALFEDFIKSGVEKEEISKVLTRSFLSALQARDLAVTKNIKVLPEETFICALLHNLGKIIVLIYLPELYRDIQTKIEAGMEEEQAAMEILDGLTYHKVGQEVAKFWNLSEKAIIAMEPKPPEPKNQSDIDSTLQNISYFSNQLVDSICNGVDITPLMGKYEKMFTVNAEEALKMVDNSIDTSEDISDSLRFGLSKLKIRNKVQKLDELLKDPEKAARLEKIKQERKKAGEETTDPENKNKEEKTEQDTDVEEELNELPISTDKSINDFIRDITETLMGPFNLNDFYANLLEGLYRGIGFDRIILAIVSIQPTNISLIGRFGLGDIGPNGVTSFQHDLANPDYAIPRALKQAKDMAIPPNASGAFPENLRYLVKGRTVYLFPICLDKKPIGLLYLDRKAGRPKLDESRIKSTRLFRDFAVMALRKTKTKK